MNPNEIQMLVVGIAIGAQLMNLLYMWWNRQDARRSSAAAKAAMRRSAGDRYLASLRLYQLRTEREARQAARR